MRRRRSLTGRWELTTATLRAARKACEREAAEAWSLLETLVAADSNADQHEGLDDVVDLMRRAWSRLGLDTQVQRLPSGIPVLVCEHNADRGVPSVLLLCHLDTVFPVGTAAMWPLEVRDDRAVGPGIADAKGGAVVAWMAVAAAMSVTDGLPGVRVQVIANTDEETGSTESRAIIEESALDADLALIYEPARPDGSIVRQRRGVRRYRVTVTGKAAHTGVEPWNGVNAIEAAAHKILALQALNDRDRSLSVTVAVARGGDRVNVVPSEAWIDVDVRLPDTQAAETTQAAIEAIIARVEIPGSSATLELLTERPPMSPHRDMASLLRRFYVAAENLGVEISDSATGGSSDGCFTSALGVPTIDGLGPVGGGYHTHDEFVRIKSIVERAAVSAAVLTTLAARRS